MKLLVCLRTSPGTGAELLDAADAQALAQAASLRAAGHTVTALYAAGTGESGAIAARLLPHVDRAVRLLSDDLPAADFHTLGQMLAMAIRRTGADVVLVPVQGDEQAAGGAPAAIARHLGARYVPFVEQIAALGDSGVEVLVRGGGRKRRLRVALPAVLATAPGRTPLPAPAPGAAEPIVETVALGDPESTVVRRRTELLGRPEPAARDTQSVSSAAALVAALAAR